MLTLVLLLLAYVLTLACVAAWFYAATSSAPVEVGIAGRGNARRPKYMTPGSACCDMFACLDDPRDVAPGTTAKIPTGIRVRLPVGYEMQIRSRSGMASRGVVVMNAPGTIDWDYHQEIFILLHNSTAHPVTVHHGDRVAQCTVRRVPRIAWRPMVAGTSSRGGFGSTGAGA